MRQSAIRSALAVAIYLLESDDPTASSPETLKEWKRLLAASEDRFSTQQHNMFMELAGLEDQIEKGHFLNVHFRAFKLANDAWLEHIRQNAIGGSRAANSPGGAVLDDDRDGDR